MQKTTYLSAHILTATVPAQLELMASADGLQCPGPSSVNGMTEGDIYDETFINGTIYWTKRIPAESDIQSRSITLGEAADNCYSTAEKHSWHRTDNNVQRGCITWNINP